MRTRSCWATDHIISPANPSLTHFKYQDSPPKGQEDEGHRHPLLRLLTASASSNPVFHTNMNRRDTYSSQPSTSTDSSAGSVAGRSPQIIDDYDLDQAVLYQYLKRRWPMAGTARLEVRRNPSSPWLFSNHSHTPSRASAESSSSMRLRYCLK